MFDSDMIEDVEEPAEMNLDVVKSCQQKQQPTRSEPLTDFRVFNKPAVTVTPSVRDLFDNINKSSIPSVSVRRLNFERPDVPKVPPRFPGAHSKLSPIGNALLGHGQSFLEDNRPRVSISKKFNNSRILGRGEEIPDLVSQASERIKRVYHEQLAATARNEHCLSKSEKLTGPSGNYKIRVSYHHPLMFCFFYRMIPIHL